MRACIPGLLLAILAALAPSGCGDETASSDPSAPLAGASGKNSAGKGGAGQAGASGACIPGQQIECACPGGLKGVQVCLPDGKSVGACSDCAGSQGGQGGAGASQGGAGGSAGAAQGGAGAGGAAQGGAGDAGAPQGGAGDGGAAQAGAGAGGDAGAAQGGAGQGGGVDASEIASDSLPFALTCSQTISATVTMKNSGTTTWTKAGGYRLEPAAGDPFLATPSELGDGDSVEPGASHDFPVTLSGPNPAASGTTSWRMVHGPGQGFGPADERTIDPSCGDQPAFDLAKVVIVGSPDVRDFAITSQLTALSFSPGTIHVDHTKRGMWPPVLIDPDGTTQEATIWVFFSIGDTWYATGGERLRPDQTDKQLDNPSKIGPGWLYDPNRWAKMTNYVPPPGALVGFMVVAGSTRSDDHVIVKERTGVVLVPFPADNQSTSFPPFAWQEP